MKTTVCVCDGWGHTSNYEKQSEKCEQVRDVTTGSNWIYMNKRHDSRAGGYFLHLKWPFFSLMCPSLTRGRRSNWRHLVRYFDENQVDPEFRKIQLPQPEACGRPAARRTHTQSISRLNILGLLLHQKLDLSAQKMRFTIFSYVGLFSPQSLWVVTWSKVKRVNMLTFLFTKQEEEEVDIVEFADSNLLSNLPFDQLHSGRERRRETAKCGWAYHPGNEQPFGYLAGEQKRQEEN